MYYPVIVHKDENSDYGGIVYDFKGCFTAGATVDELVANVQEAIECHTEGEEFDVPTPSDLATVLKSEEAEDGAVILVDVDLSFLESKSKPVNITMPIYVRNKIDRAAKASGKTRSAFIVDSALKAIQEMSVR